MQAQVAALLQPQADACWKPSTLRPMPAVIRSAPVTSSDSSFRRSEIRASAVRISATIATGTLIRKIERQVHAVSQPPSSGSRR